MNKISKIALTLFVPIAFVLGTTMTSGVYAADSTPAVASPDASPSASPTVEFTKLDLNSATADELLTIPNMTDRMVDEFMEYRPYTSIEQFRQEIGKYVSEDVVAGYEEYVYVPIEPNNADSATLQQLPGVTEDVAQMLIDGRDYASNDEFMTVLATLVSPEDAAASQPYLISN